MRQDVDPPPIRALKKVTVSVHGGARSSVSSVANDAALDPLHDYTQYSTIVPSDQLGGFPPNLQSSCWMPILALPTGPATLSSYPFSYEVLTSRIPNSIFRKTSSSLAPSCRVSNPSAWLHRIVFLIHSDLTDCSSLQAPTHLSRRKKTGPQAGLPGRAHRDWWGLRECPQGSSH